MNSNMFQFNPIQGHGVVRGVSTPCRVEWQSDLCWRHQRVAPALESWWVNQVRVHSRKQISLTSHGPRTASLGQDKNRNRVQTRVHTRGRVRQRTSGPFGQSGSKTITQSGSKNWRTVTGSSIRCTRWRDHCSWITVHLEVSCKKTCRNIYYLFTCLSIHSSMCPFIHLSIYSSIYSMCVYLSIYLSIYLLVYLFIIYLSCLFIYLLFIYLSIYYFCENVKQITCRKSKTINYCQKKWKKLPTEK